MHSGTPDQMKKQDEVIKGKLQDIKKVYLVMSGKGGVGKSSVAVNLAVALAAQGKQVGLMDTDIHGPNTLKMLGLEGQRLGSDDVGMHPLRYNDNLGVISIASMLESDDAAVIWRGPMKIGVIRQFVSDVAWGKLDYLIIDSPPGTGDEPLTVAQTVPMAEGVIVTTPQEVSLQDVRRSISFAQQLNMKVAGIIENMSGLACPHCGEIVDLFKSGGGEKIAADAKLPFLGKIPLDPAVVHAGDNGKPMVIDNATSAAAVAFNKIVKKLV